MGVAHRQLVGQAHLVWDKHAQHRPCDILHTLCAAHGVGKLGHHDVCDGRVPGNCARLLFLSTRVSSISILLLLLHNGSWHLVVQEFYRRCKEHQFLAPIHKRDHHFFGHSHSIDGAGTASKPFHRLLHWDWMFVAAEHSFEAGTCEPLQHCHRVATRKTPLALPTRQYPQKGFPA